MVKFGKREKTLAIVFGVFVVFFILDKATLSPVLEKLDYFSKQIALSETRLKKLRLVDSQRSSILSVYEKKKAYIETGKSEEDTLSLVMNDLEQMARGSGVTLLNMKPDMSLEKSGLDYRMRKMELNIEGSQREITMFLYKLENSSYALSVSRLDFEVKDRTNGLMEAEMTFYYLYFL